MRFSPLLAALLLLVACGGDDAESSSGPRVVATHPILGDIARHVVGDAATVDVIIPPGSDPHEFQPSAQDVEAITDADLVVANGFHFEEGLRDALDAAADNGAVVFELGAQFSAPLDDDPHVWLDPVQVADAVEALGVELDALDRSAAEGAWASRAAAYADEIRATDAAVEEILAAVPAERRKLVTNHETLGYFASRYGFEVIGAAIPSTSTAAQSSAATLADLADAVEAEGVPAIFADVSSPDDLARALAAEVGDGVDVVELVTETLAPAGEDGDDYLGLLQLDARRIADALS
jgi:zinc/manganese transport system substrate-binding protein